MLQASGARAVLSPRRDVHVTGANCLIAPSGLPAPGSCAAAYSQLPPGVAVARAAAARAAAAPAPASEAGGAGGRKRTHRGRGGRGQRREEPPVRHVLCTSMSN